jgi:hypothetical protein
MGYSEFDGQTKPAWNVGRKVGPKRALKQKEVWAIRFCLDEEGRLRDRALFDLAIDSKLRGCDLVRVRTDQLVSGECDPGPSYNWAAKDRPARPVRDSRASPIDTALVVGVQRRCV